MEPKVKKSWKREVAFLFLVFWLIVTWKMFLYDGLVDDSLEGPYSMFTLSVWGFASAAFGLDYVVKNKDKIMKPKIGGPQ